MATILSQTLRVYHYSFSHCCLPKSRNSYKIWPYSSSRSSKVIDLDVNRKRSCDFLLVNNSNFGRISANIVEILMLKARKWLNFPTLLSLIVILALSSTVFEIERHFLQWEQLAFWLRTSWLGISKLNISCYYITCTSLLSFCYGYPFRYLFIQLTWS